MLRVLLISIASFTLSTAAAQTDSLLKRTVLKDRKAPRSNDHLVFQVGYTFWQGQPDSIVTGGLPRSFNAYFMFDFPIKTAPKFSTAMGVGVGTDNIYFDKMGIELGANTPTLPFRNLADTNRYKKYKLATTYLEAPLELRFTSDPDNDKKSIKAALGIKGGILVNAHTKGKDLENRSGNQINDNKIKEYNRRFLNRNRFAATARLGYGAFSLFGTYQLNTLFKEGVAAPVRPVTIGLTISGL